MEAQRVWIRWLEIWRPGALLAQTGAAVCWRWWGFTQRRAAPVHHGGELCSKAASPQTRSSLTSQSLPTKANCLEHGVFLSPHNYFKFLGSSFLDDN